MEKEIEIGKGYRTTFEYISNELGKGSFGKVYKCVDEKGEIYAAKEIVVANGSNTHQYIKQEIELLNMIAKENIINTIRLKDCIEKEVKDNKAHLIIIFELCEGKDLEYLISTAGPFSEENIKTILLPVVEGFNHLHKVNVIHRDLKPANILLKKEWRDANSEKPQIRICDFGISTKTKEESTNLISNVGTEEYKAPETIESTEMSDKVDVFSFGVIFYRMLFGLNPFTRTTISTWHKSPNNGVLRIPKARKLTAECFDVLQGCLRIHASDRFSFEDLNAHPFFRSKTKGIKLLSMFDGSSDVLFYPLFGHREDYLNEEEPGFPKENPINKMNELFLNRDSD